MKDSKKNETAPETVKVVSRVSSEELDDAIADELKKNETKPGGVKKFVKHDEFGKGVED